MTILNLEERKAVIIEPDDKTARFAEYILKKAGIKKVFIVNLRCLNSHFKQIKDLSENTEMQKIFHGCSEEIFNNVMQSLHLMDRQDIYYIARLKTSEVVIAYWKHRFKIFQPLLLKGEEV